MSLYCVRRFSRSSSSSTWQSIVCNKQTPIYARSACARANSYNHHLNPRVPDTCPDCNTTTTTTHNVSHLFECLVNQTDLTPVNLWQRGRWVPQHLITDSMESRLLQQQQQQQPRILQQDCIIATDNGPRFITVFNQKQLETRSNQ